MLPSAENFSIACWRVKKFPVDLDILMGKKGKDHVSQVSWKRSVAKSHTKKLKQKNIAQNLERKKKREVMPRDEKLNADKL